MTCSLATSVKRLHCSDDTDVCPEKLCSLSKRREIPKYRMDFTKESFSATQSLYKSIVPCVIVNRSGTTSTNTHVHFSALGETVSETIYQAPYWND